ncbi:MAG: hypothetical protein DYH17_11235 [Xanthomonadales bacterium PRO6]|nr:hypothetical protein [Xanthomonadales bacterium PRO6]
MAVGPVQAEQQAAKPEQSAPAVEQAPQMEAPTLEWVPGPLLSQTEPAPGRVASPAVGLAFTLPEAWRAEDVGWRELTLEEAQSISPLAEAGLVVELRQGRAAQPLLTLYRASLEPWRKADREGKAGPGRLTFNTADKVYLVVRGAEARKAGRYADLRNALEDAVGTLALYDAYREDRNVQAAAGGEFAGTLVGGGLVTLSLMPGGELGLRIGERALSGKWVLRQATIIGQLVGAGEGVNPALQFHLDGDALIAMRWDAKLFGNTGVRLEKAQ